MIRETAENRKDMPEEREKTFELIKQIEDRL